MLKRLTCVLLAALLLFVTVSCRRDPSPDVEGDTTSPSTDPFTDSDATTNDVIITPGHEPDDPALDEKVVAARLDALTLNGDPCFEGDIPSSLEAADYTLVIRDGTPLTYITLSGWIGFSMAIDSFGYSVDGGEGVYGLFSTYTEEAVKAEGGAYALRFTVTVPLINLKPGSHTVCFVARLADGTVAELLPPISLSREGLEVDASRPFHSSLTHVNGKGPRGSEAYTDRGGNTERGVDILDAVLEGHKPDQDRLLRVSGWFATEGGVERYVWSADGITWYPAVNNGATGEPSEGYFAELGFENATENAVFADLTLDLTPYNERGVAVTVGGVPKDAPDTVVPFVTVTGLTVPYLPRDIEFTYTSDLDSNAVGDDIRSTDLSYMFDFAYGAGETRFVAERDGEIVYAYDGIHSFQASMEGTFAMTARIQEMRGCSFLFIRGTRAVRSVVEVPLRLDNFYETDGLGLCGGAGIYAKLADGTLTVVIKGLDPNADYRIKNYTYYFPANGSELTLADDGRTVRILVDGKEITSVRLDGETEYPEHLDTVSPAIKFAETAVIILANGKTETVVNTLVASTCVAQCGAAVRGGGLYFDEISVMPYSEFAAKQ